MNYPYWAAIALLMLGLYTMIAQANYFKKFIGMTIFQSAIILFFLLTSVKRDATLPVVATPGTPSAAMMNPLPHALMLTAIVVAVATAGVAFAILVRLYATYGSLEEGVIAARVTAEPHEP
ncbi:MAG: cation:proton antiporter subunit C [Candidatus Rokubacteria bacterium]|nr:cation:proton antiporter subunit C [Candidatus Rokubacteria bacterium]